MPTLAEIIKEKSDRLDSVPTAFNKRVIDSQKEIFAELLELLDKLDKNNGEIIISAKNLDIIDDILEKLQGVVNQSEYVGAVRDFAKEFDQQGKITQEYFEKAFDRTEFTKLQEAVLKAKKREAVELLVGGNLDGALYSPIRKILTNSVSSGSSLKDTIAGLRNVIEGGDSRLGTLDRYTKQIAYDAMATADRAYTNAIADEIGAEWYRYVGGEIKDTREFCHTRNGNYYHRKEVESWGLLKEWDGKAKGTNPNTIFILAGGYNCQHSILPVLKSSVPKDVIERNIANGNYSE